MTESQPRSHVLVCYDGSAHADHAAREAARLFPGAQITILTVRAQSWLAPFTTSELHSNSENPLEQVALRLDQEAQATAEAGVAILRSAGVEASADTSVVENSVWHCIVEYADDEDIDAIVVGSKGRSNLKAALLGSVSAGVVSHARQPVLVTHLR